MQEHIGPVLEVEREVYISFLPLAHAFERLVVTCLLRIYSPSDPLLQEIKKRVTEM